MSKLCVNELGAAARQLRSWGLDTGAALRSLVEACTYEAGHDILRMLSYGIYTVVVDLTRRMVKLGVTKGAVGNF